MIKVVNSDCLCFLSSTNQKFDLIFSDPPFNIGQSYKGFNDNIKDYENFTLKWVSNCWHHCGGVLALHGNDTLCEIYLQIAKELNMHRIAWVNWHYRFGQNTRKNWIDSRCHCLIYTKSHNYTWNPESVLVDSDRMRYKDKRIGDYDNGGKRLPMTIWGVESDGPYWGRVQGNNKERRHNHPNQLPEVYLERLIKAYTNEDDWVFDPFGGSGTTAVVCKALNRNCITTEVSEESCSSIKERLDLGAIRVKQ